MTFGQKFNLGISGKQNFRIFLSKSQKEFFRADNALKVWSSVSHPSPTISYLARNTGSSGCSITANYGLLATAIEVGVELTIRPPKKIKKKLINNLNRKHYKENNLGNMDLCQNN